LTTQSRKKCVKLGLQNSTHSSRKTIQWLVTVAYSKKASGHIDHPVQEKVREAGAAEQHTQQQEDHRVVGYCSIVKESKWPH
jgi:hypothetical protein